MDAPTTTAEPTTGRSRVVERVLLVATLAVVCLLAFSLATHDNGTPDSGFSSTYVDVN